MILLDAIDCLVFIDTSEMFAGLIQFFGEVFVTFTEFHWNVPSSHGDEWILRDAKELWRTLRDT